LVLMTVSVVAALVWWADPVGLSPLRAAGILAGWAGSGLLLVSLLLMLREPALARWLGGLDTMYHWHHVLGVWAYVLLLVHPLMLAAAAWGESPARAWATLAPWQQGWPVWLGWGSLLGMMVGLLAALSPRLPYAAWRKLHHLLSLSVVLGAAHLVLLGLDGVLLAVPVLVIAFLLWRVLRADHGLGARPYVVEQVEHLSPTTVELTLQPLAGLPGGARPLRPGQFVLAAFHAGPQYQGCGEFHPYTVSGTDAEGRMALAIKALGDCTHLLQSIRPGAEARVQGPFGSFLASLESGPGLWLAGGIGITPFIAALRRGPVQLIYLHREGSEAPFTEELAEHAERQPLLKLQIVATGNDMPDLADFLPTTEALCGADCYLCGPSTMVDAATGLLQTRGVDRSRIHFERFDFR
jgi:predicted ferric reductase